MEFLNALSIELCDTVLCCNNWYADGKPPQSPSPEEEKTSSQEIQENDFLVSGQLGEIDYKARSNPASKHSSLDRDETPDRHAGWEMCDIRKPQKPRPTLKEIAEEFILQQKAEEALQAELDRIRGEKEKKEEEEENKLLKKDGSFVTTDGDDDSMDLRASSFCSVSSNNMLTIDQINKKDSSQDNMSCDEMEDPIRPSSKLETDSKDSGYGAEVQFNRSKRKLAKIPHHRSLEEDGLRKSPIPYDCEPDVCYDGLPQRPNTSCEADYKVKKKHGFFSSFRSNSKKNTDKESEDEKRPSTKKKRKKKSSSSSNLQVAPKQSFVLRGKKSPECTNNTRVPGHYMDNGDM